MSQQIDLETQRRCCECHTFMLIADAVTVLCHPEFNGGATAHGLCPDCAEGKIPMICPNCTTARKMGTTECHICHDQDEEHEGPILETIKARELTPSDVIQIEAGLYRVDAMQIFRARDGRVAVKVRCAEWRENLDFLQNSPVQIVRRSQLVPWGTQEGPHCDSGLMLTGLAVRPRDRVRWDGEWWDVGKEVESIPKRVITIKAVNDPKRTGFLTVHDAMCFQFVIT